VFVKDKKSLPDNKEFIPPTVIVDNENPLFTITIIKGIAKSK